MIFLKNYGIILKGDEPCCWGNVIPNKYIFYDTFHRSPATLYLTNLEIYSEIPETKSYKYIFGYIFLFTYLLDTEFISL